MAAKCLLDSNYTSLTPFCSGTLINKTYLDNQKVNSLLTDTSIGLTYLNKDFFICENHLKQLETRLYNRKRYAFCDVPKIISSHGSETYRRDRSISFATSLKVNDLYGVLIPVGTGKIICKF